MRQECSPSFSKWEPFFLSSLSSHILHPLGPISSSTHTKRPAGSSLFHGATYLLLREESVVISLKLTDVGVEIIYTGLTECIRAILSVVWKCLLKKQGQDASRVLANGVGRNGAMVLQGGDLPCMFSTWVQLSASHMGPWATSGMIFEHPRARSKPWALSDLAPWPK